MSPRALFSSVLAVIAALGVLACGASSPYFGADLLYARVAQGHFQRHRQNGVVFHNQNVSGKGAGRRLSRTGHRGARIQLGREYPRLTTRTERRPHRFPARYEIRPCRDTVSPS